MKIYNESNMKVIRKYTAIKLGTVNVDDNIEVRLSYGEIDGPYYSRVYPSKEFDSEDEAMKHAYIADKYATWLIVPIINFDD